MASIQAFLGLILVICVVSLHGASNVYGWGRACDYGCVGQFSIGANVTAPDPSIGFQTPVAIDYFSSRNVTIVSISLLKTLNIAISDNGSVYLWGSAGNFLNFLVFSAAPSFTFPGPVPSLERIGPVQGLVYGACVGYCDSYALLRNGTVLRATNWPNVIWVTVPEFVNAGVCIVKIGTVAGGTFFALSEDGVLYAWGKDDQGLLGNGPALTNPVNGPAPIQFFIDNGLFITDFQGGRDYGYGSEGTMGALTSTGKLYSWGTYQGAGYEVPMCIYIDDYYSNPSHIISTPMLANLTANMTLSKIRSSGGFAAPSVTSFVQDTQGTWWYCLRGYINNCCSNLRHTAIFPLFNASAGIVDAVSGIEAAFALNENGTLYSWGNDAMGATGATEQVVNTGDPGIMPFFANMGARVTAFDGAIHRAYAVVGAPCPPFSATFDETDAADDDCYACPPGTFADTSLSASRGVAVRCTPCAAGSFTNTSGAAACMRCPLGTYSLVTGAFRCLTCAGGLAPNAAQTGCVVCPAGSKAQPGDATCTACDAGTYSPSAKTAICPSCAPGHYSAPNATVCIPCPPGTFGSIQGVEACSPCGIGLYSNYTAASSQYYCQKCPTLSTTINETVTAPEDCTCLPFADPIPNEAGCYCEAGYGLAADGASCQRCTGTVFKTQPGNFPCQPCPDFSVATIDATACACIAGYYASVSRGGACTACPLGGDCSAGTLIPQVGYWHADSSAELFYECTPADACLSSGCAVGYVNGSVLCSQCAPTYAKTLGGGCVYCPQSNPYFVGLFLVPFVLLALGFLYWSSLAASRSIPLITIVLNFLQLVNETALVPRPVSNYVGVFSFDAAGIIPTVCTVPLPFVALWLIQIFTPLLLLVPMMGIVYARKVAKRSLNFARERMACMLTIVVSTYVLVTTNVFRIFSCSQPVEGARLLLADRSIVCWSAAHIPLVAGATVVLIIFVIGAPAMLAGAIYRPAWWPSRLTVDVGFLTEAYTEGAGGWEVVLMVRRLCFVLVSQVGASEYVWTTTALALMAAVTLRMHLRWRPFRDETANKIETEALFALLACCALRQLQAALLASPNSISNSAGQLAADILVSVVVVGFIGYVLIGHRREIKERLKNGCRGRTSESVGGGKISRSKSIDMPIKFETPETAETGSAL